MKTPTAPLRPAADLRADPAAYTLRVPIDSRLAAVDRTAGTLTGLAILSGSREASGHGIYIDDRTLQTGLDSVAAAGGRMRGAISHGSLLDFLRRGSDRILEIPGYFDSIRRQGDSIIGDFSFFESFRASAPGAVERIMEMATKTPDLFGLSAEPCGYLVYLATDGREFTILRDPDSGAWSGPPEGIALANDELPTLRITRMRVAAFVDEPAANDGLFARFAAGLGRLFGAEPTATFTAIEQALRAWSASSPHETVLSRPSGSDDATPTGLAPVESTPSTPPPATDMNVFADIHRRFAAGTPELAAARALLDATPDITLEALLAAVPARIHAGLSERITALETDLAAARASLSTVTTERDTALATVASLKGSGHPAPLNLGAASAGALVPGTPPRELSGLARVAAAFSSDSTNPANAGRN